MRELTEREAAVLTAIVHAHIDTAEPVGSRTISRRYLTDLSPATIRNTMMDLEELGLLGKPHTSAGREPTPIGYRLYITSLMRPPRLVAEDQRAMEQAVRASVSARDADTILTYVARALADVSHQIGVAFLPSFDSGMFQKLDLIDIAESRVLVAIQVEGGPVHTLTLELEEPVRRELLSATTDVLNERLSGLTMGQIRATIAERLRGVNRGDPQVISLFLRDGGYIFNLDVRANIHLEGRPNILTQPEFEDRSVLGLVMRELDGQDLQQELRNRGGIPAVNVTIGTENKIVGLAACSLLTRGYNIGPMSGTLAILGPMRMPYRRLVAALDHAADLVEDALN